MKSILSIIMICATLLVSAQNNQVQNASNYLRNKEYDKAKASADAAAVHDATKNSAKLWMYRGQIYEAIYESKLPEVNKLDDMAQEKAVESYVTCLKLDKDNIYKDQMKGYLVVSSAALDYKVKYYMSINDYDKAIKALDLLETTLPYDFDQGLKRANITKENLMFSHYKVYSLAGNKEKTTEYADKLIEAKYKDPTIYTNMAKINLQTKDTAKALSYIEKGKMLFDDNMDLINQEINIYLAQKKTDVLKAKLKDAIQLAPDNEILHSILANLYDKTNDQESAEKEYLTALEIKPDYEIANYNLGVLYFNMGNQWNQKLNDLPLDQNKKAKEYEAKANEYFTKATINLERSYEIAPDAATKQRLKQLFTKLGNTEKVAKYK
jgi:Tfp pilus assembly protein PilF